MVKKDISYITSQYTIISGVADGFGEYPEFKKKYSELIIKQSSMKDCGDFLVKFYNKVLEDAVEYLKRKIKRLKISGQSLSDVEDDLEEIRMRIRTGNPDLIELHSIKNSLVKIDNKLKDKRRIVAVNKKRIRKERGISFIIGLIVGFVGSKFFK